MTVRTYGEFIVLPHTGFRASGAVSRGLISHSKELQQRDQPGVSARYNMSDAEIMLPTRKYVPRSNRQLEHTKT